MLKQVTWTGSVLVLCLLAGCRREAAPAETFPGAPVILISIDTLRSDRLPSYGYQGVSTPNLDRLRRDSILFQHAYSHCPMTLPSHISMLTGLLPAEHGVRNNIGYRFDSTRYATLPKLLSAAGYATAASVSSYVLRGDSGMAPMFTDYDDDIPIGTAGAFSQHQRPGGVAVAFAKSWIEQKKGEPFFFLLHLYEPHAPYEPPEPFRSRYANRYDGEVAVSDALVGEFLDALRKNGLYDKAIIILTSDHGEGLMDHGEDQHGILLYREAIQVPLLLKLPTSRYAGEAVTTPVQHIDIMPTVTDLLALSTDAKFSGSSLLAFLGKPLPSRSIYSETLYPRIHLGWSELRSLVSGTSHYIEAPRAELYDLARDGVEKNNVIAADRRLAATLKKQLEGFPNGIEQIADIDPEEARKLAALGYIGTPSASRKGGVLPNPIDEIGSLDKIKGAFRLADEREYGQAVSSLRELLKENPALSEARDKLGETLVAAGRYGEAVDVYREAIRRSERFSSDMALSLANALLQAGELEEARKYADLALHGNPMRGHELLTRIALRRQDIIEARRQASQAMDERRPQPSIMLLQAEVLRAGGDLQGALLALNRAESRASSMGVPRLHRLNYLRGDVLARMGRPVDAEAAYQKAISEFPDDLQSYANLSVIYFVQGRVEMTRKILETMARVNPDQRAYKLAADTLESFGLSEDARKYRRRMNE